jgi:hypothetical protein
LVGTLLPPMRGGPISLSEKETYGYQSIITNHSNDTTIVINPRTCEWLTGREFFIQSSITDFEYFEGVEKFFDEKYFRMDYNKNDIMIFILR